MSDEWVVNCIEGDITIKVYPDFEWFEDERVSCYIELEGAEGQTISAEELALLISILETAHARMTEVIE